MTTISRLQFPDELDFRVALAEKGISGAAADFLVRDEVSNRERTQRLKSLSGQTWNTTRSFTLIEVVRKDLHPSELPAPELVAALTRLILAAELCTVADQRHPALRELAGDKHQSNAREWNAAIVGALQSESEKSKIRIEPGLAGTALSVAYTGGHIAGFGEMCTVSIPAIGDSILPRVHLVALVIEALHRLSGTRRNHVLPAAELSGVQFSGSGADWSMLLNPLADGGFDGSQLEPAADGSRPLIILPPK